MPAVGARVMLSEKGKDPPPDAAYGLVCSQFLSRRLNSRAVHPPRQKPPSRFFWRTLPRTAGLNRHHPLGQQWLKNIYTQRCNVLGFHLPLSYCVLWRILETITLPDPLGFRTTLLDSFLWLLQETIPLSEVLGFHTTFTDGLLLSILETRGVGIAVAGSSERVAVSVGLGFKQPGPVTLPDIPANDRPTELPAVPSSVFAATPSLPSGISRRLMMFRGFSCATFGHFPKVNALLPLFMRNLLPLAEG